MTKDFGGSIVAQLIEVGLHTRYSNDIEGGRCAKDMIAIEVQSKGWDLPPYSHVEVPTDKLAEYHLPRFLEKSDNERIDKELRRHRTTNSAYWIAAQMLASSQT